MLSSKHLNIHQHDEFSIGSLPNLYCLRSTCPQMYIKSESNIQIFHSETIVSVKMEAKGHIYSMQFFNGDRTIVQCAPFDHYYKLNMCSLWSTIDNCFISKKRILLMLIPLSLYMSCIFPKWPLLILFKGESKHVCTQLRGRLTVRVELSYDATMNCRATELPAWS